MNRRLTLRTDKLKRLGNDRFRGDRKSTTVAEAGLPAYSRQAPRANGVAVKLKEGEFGLAKLTGTFPGLSRRPTGRAAYNGRFVTLAWPNGKDLTAIAVKAAARLTT